MKRKIFFSTAVLLSATAVHALEIMCVPTGEIHFREPCTEIFLPTVYMNGWHGLSRKGPWTIEKDGRALFRLERDNRKKMDGSLSLERRPDGRTRVTYTFTAAEKATFQTVACTIRLPIQSVEGRSWHAETEKGVRQGTFTPPKRGISLASYRDFRTFSFPLGNTGRTLTVHPVEGDDMMIQDNRRWEPTYSIRIGHLGSVSCTTGTCLRIVFDLTADEPLDIKPYGPVTVTRNRDWIPLRYTKDILAGSALDFSGMGLTDAPAGKHGWLKNVSGHFEFENLPGRPQRFYGVNLCGTANFPSHETADLFVTRLKRLGYNTIRLHHHDAGTVRGSPDALTLDADMMDRLDYLVAAAIREGLYITTDLFVSRTQAPITWRQIGVDRDGNVDMQLFKALCAVHDPAFENWAAYARNFLLHVNPYTGRRYLDEPAMPFICLVNEGGLFMGWGRENRTDPRIRAAWRAWVLKQRAQDPAFDPSADPDELPRSTAHASLARFMGDLEARMTTRMKTFLRGLGCKALLTNNNCGGHPAPLLAAKTDYDYVDDHFYVDHPTFLEKRWRLPSRFGNRNPILTRRLVPGQKAFTRLADRPFTITEWNFSGPGMYRGVGGILTGAMAALQDWDGLWRFAYAHNKDLLVDNPERGPGYFDLGSDPLGQASDRASICLFLRGDLAPLPAEKGLALLVTPAAVKPAGDRALSAAPSWSDAAWNRRMASCLTAGAAGPMSVVPRERAEDADVTNRAWQTCGTSAVSFDRTHGAFTLDTPRTCGGFTPAGKISAGALRATVTGSPATVWVSALDHAPVKQSRRMLLTHLTDVQGEGTRFATPRMTVLLKWGKTPLVRNGRAEIALALDRPTDFTVWELETSGRRLRKIPSAVRDGCLAFTASVEGPDGARMLYEIAAD